MLEIVVAGGWLMVPIILCSIAVAAIAVERYWTLTPSRIAPRHLLAQVWGWIKNNQLDGNKIRELKRSSELGKILAAGLSNSRSGREVMKDSIEEAASQVIHDMERYLGAMGTIAAITPLLGLLGTVVGMIEVFTEIMLQGTGNAGVLAGGISQALITTAAGLSVAIPAMILHRYFQRRVDTLVVTMEQDAVKLVDALHSDRRVDIKTA
ncbi:MAG: MotA/TolQ/ExbB proton channel family protein [Cellvibrionaceae bacterium]